VGILTTYLMEMSGLNQVTSKIGLLIFLSGVAAGRVLVGVFSRREQLPRLVLLLFGGAALFLAALFFTDIRQGIYILVFFTGVTISALLPLIITLAGLLYPAHSGTVLGIIKIAIPIGGTLIPFLLSVLARYGSFHLSLALFPAVASAGFVLLLANQGSLNRSLKSTEPAA
jgi:fucose permease